MTNKINIRHSAYAVINKLFVAFAIALLFKILFFSMPDVIGIDLAPITIIIFVIWEVNKTIDKWLNTKYSWIENSKQRLIAQAIAFTAFTSIALFLLMFSLHQIKFGDGRIINHKMQEMFLPALFFALALITIYISFNFFKSWKKSLVEIEKYKTQSTEAQLQNLKKQINPHFLFNNLSVLSSLVYQNQDKAVEFINELSKVYRYVLDNENSELVTLKEELNFLHHYTYLLKIRFEDAISFSVTIDENDKHCYLPPMCLQMLLENIIQHNEVSQENPLKVNIHAKDNALTIENKIQLRSDKPESSRTGLKNIESRYAYFTNKAVEISNNGILFKVTLPLLSKK